MNRLLFFAMLLLAITNCYGQYGTLGWLSGFDSLPFDPATISINKINTVYVIETSGNRDIDGFAEKRDTIATFHFDTSGYQIPESIQKDSSVIMVNVTKSDSTITKYIIRSYQNKFDTALIYKNVFTRSGKLLEEQRSSTKFYRRVMSCIHGSEYHYKYAYDKSGRIIYYRDFNYWYYRKISYTDYGKRVETYDAKTDKLLDTEHVLINYVHDKLNDTWTKTETYRTRQVTKAYTDNLLRIETIVEISYFPTIRYFEYEYKSQ